MWKRLSETENTKQVIIVACGKCGEFLLAKSEHKTRTCPYCGSKVIIEKAKKVASTENAQKASAILQELKRRKGERAKP